MFLILNLLSISKINLLSDLKLTSSIIKFSKFKLSNFIIFEFIFDLSFLTLPSIKKLFCFFLIIIFFEIKLTFSILNLISFNE